jgi:hypothetical protein
MSQGFIFYLIEAVVAVLVGGLAGWLLARRRLASLQTSLQELETSVQNLSATVTNLASTAQNNATVATWKEERVRLAYTQAADWLKLANNVTWTMSSIYLVGSLIALNGALSQSVIGTIWRPIVGLAVVAISIIWVIFDVVYSYAARSARDWLVATESHWDTSAQFYSGQRNSTAKAGRWAVTMFLWLSICVPAVLGVIIAKPILPTFVADYLPDIK